MADTIHNLFEAKSQLSRRVERAAAPRRRHKPGGWKGQVVIGADFDAPLPANQRKAFEGRK